jgi:hypothetical protein
MRRRADGGGGTSAPQPVHTAGGGGGGGAVATGGGGGAGHRSQDRAQNDSFIQGAPHWPQSRCWAQVEDEPGTGTSTLQSIAGPSAHCPHARAQ